MQMCEENKRKMAGLLADDMLDRTKTHLRQYDKPPLRLWRGCMGRITTVLLWLTRIFIGNSWADKRNDKARKRFYGHLLPIWHWQQKMSEHK